MRKCKANFIFGHCFRYSSSSFSLSLSHSPSLFSLSLSLSQSVNSCSLSGWPNERPVPSSKLNTCKHYFRKYWSFDHLLKIVLLNARPNVFRFPLTGGAFLFRYFHPLCGWYWFSPRTLCTFCKKIRECNNWCIWFQCSYVYNF